MPTRPLVALALLAAAGLAWWQPWQPSLVAGVLTVAGESTSATAPSARGTRELERPGLDEPEVASERGAPAAAAERRPVEPARRTTTRLILMHTTSGRPLGGLRIHVRQSRLSETVLTSALGSAQLTEPFVDGGVDVELRDADDPQLRNPDYTLDRERIGLLTNTDHYLVARPVPWQLELQLLTAGGDPPQGGTVSIGLDANRFRSFERDAQWTEERRVVNANDEGRASAPLTATERDSRMLLAAGGLQAAEQVHVPVALESPIDSGPHVLRFVAAATLRVRVQDASGNAVEAAEVRVNSGWPTWAVRNEKGTTDANGELTLDALVPGSWRVDWILAPGSSLKWRPRDVILESGVETFAELRAAEGLPSDLLASGRALSHDGRPLTGCEITAFDARGQLASAGTNAQGEFTLRGDARTGSLELVGRKRRSNVVFAGMPLRTAVGSRDLELRAAAPVELCRVTFRMEQGGEGPGGTVFAPVIAFQLDSELSGQASLLAQPETRNPNVYLVPPATRLRWRARSQGYRDATGVLPALSPGAEFEAVGRMEPGLSLRVRVIDRETGGPIAGARFELEPEQVLGTSGADGWASPQWDEWTQWIANVHVRHPDYAPSGIHVEDHLFEHGSIWLTDQVVRMTRLQSH